MMPSQTIATQNESTDPSYREGLAGSSRAGEGCHEEGMEAVSPP